MNDELKTVVTHEGRHHADEVLACWFYSVLLGGRIKVVRSSDPEVHRQADVLLDCGGVYNPAQHRFDHHGNVPLPQPPATRACGYATAGLVWREHGRRICATVLDGSHAGPWAAFKRSMTADELEEFYRHLVMALDSELVAPIDAWDLGIYPDRHTSRQVLPFQWILPHLEFDHAVTALGKAFMQRLRVIAETQANECTLEEDLRNNGPSAFWMFGPWLVVKAEDGRRVEIRAAKRFAQRALNIPLLAVVSSLRGGSRWGAFLCAPLPDDFPIQRDLEYAAGRRCVFHDSPERLLEFLRDLADQNALPTPGFCVESGHDHASSSSAGTEERL